MRTLYMKCIFCAHHNTEVAETRVADNGTIVRRRRRCGTCLKRFTTYERVERLPIIVVKRDTRRERFDRDKLKKGILKSCEKTSVSFEQIEKIAEDIETDIKQEDSAEIESNLIGSLIGQKLK